MKKIVFIDVDGTLVLDDQSILNSTILACKQARKNGHLLFLCTGRSKAELYHDIVEIGFDGLICAGGGYAEIAGIPLFHQSVMQAHVDHVIAYFQEKNIDYYLESNGGLYASEFCVPSLLKRLNLQNKEEHPFTNALIEHENPHRKDINKICFLSSNTPFDEVKEEFQEEFEVIACTVSAFGAQSGELAVKGVSKQSAIIRILDVLAIQQKDTIAIGDGMNDKDMIVFCHTGIAMGNAKEGLKEVADYVCEDILADGFYKAFEKYQLI